MAHGGEEAMSTAVWGRLSELGLLSAPTHRSKFFLVAVALYQFSLKEVNACAVV